MPDQEFMITLVKNISEKTLTISSLKSMLKDVNLTYLIRSIAWMNKFDIIEIQIH